MLVWFELHETMESAIKREKQIKARYRVVKGILIGKMNPEWRDLYDGIVSRREEMDCSASRECAHLRDARLTADF
jgi:putative endonuclease